MSGSGHGSEEVALWMDQLNDRYWGCVEHHAGQDRAGFSNHATTNTTTASTVIGNRNSSTCGNRDGSGQGSSTASRQPGSVGANDMCDVITFSHFVPHQELLPEKRCLMYPYLVRLHACSRVSMVQASLQVAKPSRALTCCALQHSYGGVLMCAASAQRRTLISCFKPSSNT